jgi:hypothetical protein
VRHCQIRGFQRNQYRRHRNRKRADECRKSKSNARLSGELNWTTVQYWIVDLIAIMGNAPTTGRSRFFFIIRSPDWEDDDLAGTMLPSEIAAVAYAYRIIRELKTAGGYDDSNLFLIVKNYSGEIVASIPFQML